MKAIFMKTGRGIFLSVLSLTLALGTGVAVADGTQITLPINGGGMQDADGDGIPDAVDICPDEADHSSEACGAADAETCTELWDAIQRLNLLGLSSGGLAAAIGLVPGAAPIAAGLGFLSLSFATQSHFLSNTYNTRCRANDG